MRKNFHPGRPGPQEFGLQVDRCRARFFHCRCYPWHFNEQITKVILLRSFLIDMLWIQDSHWWSSPTSLPVVEGLGYTLQGVQCLLLLLHPATMSGTPETTPAALSGAASCLPRLCQGTAHYMAPEVMRGKGYGLEVDARPSVWSEGLHDILGQISHEIPPLGAAGLLILFLEAMSRFVLH